MEDFFRQDLASLKGSEAKLLVILFAHGPQSNPELKRLSGVRDNKTFYDAVHRLRELGFLDEVGKTNFTGWEIQPPRLENPTYRLENPTPLVGKTNYPGVSGVQPQLENPTASVGKSNQDSREIQPELENPTEDFESAFASVDDMEAGGDDRDPHSPFGLRRKAQIDLIQQAWSALFGPPELSFLGAKELLQTARSQASLVYAAMVHAQGHKAQYPKAYVKKVLEEQARKPIPFKPSQPKTEEEVGALRPVTQEMRDSWDEAERKLKASGKLDHWEL